MMLSFFVAVIVTPWLMLRIGGRAARRRMRRRRSDGGWLGARLRRRGAARSSPRARAAWMFLLAVGVATLLSLVLFATKSVTVKLLPFDNKSELQVVVDLPRGASLEETDRVLAAAAARLAGSRRSCRRSRPMPARPRRSTSTASCATTICASEPQQGDLQVNLTPKDERNRASHDIALDVRKRLDGLAAARRHRRSRSSRCRRDRR